MDLLIVEASETAIQIVGYIATFFCGAAALPQVIRTIKTKSTAEVNLWTFIVLTLGFIFWLIEGILMNHIPMIIGNAFGSACQLTIIGFKIFNLVSGKEGKKKDKECE